MWARCGELPVVVEFVACATCWWSHTRMWRLNATFRVLLVAGI